MVFVIDQTRFPHLVVLAGDTSFDGDHVSCEQREQTCVTLEVGNPCNVPGLPMCDQLRPQ
jgi:hypothetical protein